MTGVAVVFTIIIAYMITHRIWRWAAPFILGATFYGLYMYRHEVFQAKGIRLKMWAAYLDYLIAKESFWFGIGPGTFEIYGPTIGIANPVVPGNQNGPPIYSTAWAHNDWLQILWEYGVVGFAVFSGLYLYLLLRAWGKPHVFAGLMGFGTCMFFYSPLHFLLSQLVLFIYARKALAN